MSVVTSAQSALVMNAFAAIFENNLISKDLVTWKQYDGELEPTNRMEVVEQVGPRYNVVETVDGVANLSSGVQGSVFGSERFRVNRTFNTSMGWGDFVKIRDVGAARESEALKNAAINLAEKIDFHVMSAITNASNNWVGGAAAGTAINNLTDFMSATTRFMEEGVAKQDIRAALAPIDRQTLSNYVVGLNSPDALATGTFREGFNGLIDGIPTMFTQQLATLTVGTRAASGASLINGASQNVNYRAVAVSPAAGQYMSQTIAVDGLTSGHTVVAGEVFTIANVFAYDNRKGAAITPQRLQQFTVLETATANGSGQIAALRIFPAIIVPGTGGDATIQGENSAHATVTAAPADNAAITYLGAASATLAPRFLIQKQAVVVNTAQLSMPDSDTAMRRSLGKIPLSVRMWKWSDGATGAHSVRFDVALTANIRDRRRIVRLNGA